jgi:putative membrane protein
MSETVLESLAGVPFYVAYFGIALALLTASLALYSGLTSHSELRLVREGNAAAAASMGGALIGFALPLTRAVALSPLLLDMVVWAAVALVVQLVALVGIRAMMPVVVRQAGEGRVASGVLLGAVAIVLGLLNAAAMTF